MSYIVKFFLTLIICLLIFTGAYSQSKNDRIVYQIEAIGIIRHIIDQDTKQYILGDTIPTFITFYVVVDSNKYYSMYFQDGIGDLQNIPLDKVYTINDGCMIFDSYLTGVRFVWCKDTDELSMFTQFNAESNYFEFFMKFIIKSHKQTKDKKNKNPEKDIYLPDDMKVV